MYVHNKAKDVLVLLVENGFCSRHGESGPQWKVHEAHRNADPSSRSLRGRS